MESAGIAHRSTPPPVGTPPERALRGRDADAEAPAQPGETAGEAPEAEAGKRGFVRTARDYFALTKPRIISLLLWTTVAATVFALAVPFFGPGSRLFGFVPLSPMEMGTVVGIVTTYLAATEATKRWFFRPRGLTPI